MIIIITLFQENNISDIGASLRYGPQLQLQCVPFMIEKCKLFTVCTENDLWDLVVAIFRHLW